MEIFGRLKMLQTAGKQVFNTCFFINTIQGYVNIQKCTYF